MSAEEPDRRWPRRVYGVGTEPDPRFTFANERTFLAWIRTALGFIAAGVAIAAVAHLGPRIETEVRIASTVLIICGLVSGVSAMMRWVQNERALRLGLRLPSSLMLPVLIGGLVVVSVIAFLAVGLG